MGALSDDPLAHGAPAVLAFAARPLEQRPVLLEPVVVASVAEPPPVADPAEEPVRAPFGQARVVRRRHSMAVRLLTDVVALGAVAAVFAVVSLPGDPGGQPLVWEVPLLALLLAFFVQRGMYDWPPRLQLREELHAVLTATALAALVSISARALLAEDAGAAPALALMAASCGLLVGAGRTALWASRTRSARTGGGGAAVIVGAGRIGQLTARRLLETPSFGLQPVGFVDDDPPPIELLAASLPVLGSIVELERLAAQHGVDHVIVAFSSAPDGMLPSLLRRCRQAGLTVSIVPRLFELESRRLRATHLGGLPLIRVRTTDPKGWQFAVKYAADRVAAALLLVALAPLLAVLAAAVRVSMGSPVLFRQRRVGLDGREFDLLKFRTMRPGEGAVIQMLPPDTAPGGVEGIDRRTRLGALLRRTALDELPQLVNVLRGEMSLVGPRPERPEFVQLFNENIYRYDDRHRVKSGMTGWAQVHGFRGRTSVSDRAELDNHYIENWSLGLDLMTLLLTIPCLVRSRVEEWPGA